VLKNSKITGLRKSRKCSALAISAAARLCRIDTGATQQFHGGPIAAFIDVVGDFATGVLVGGGVANDEFSDRLFAAGNR
jgi:hypothetical protein